MTLDERVAALEGQVAGLRMALSILLIDRPDDRRRLEAASEKFYAHALGSQLVDRTIEQMRNELDYLSQDRSV